MTAKSYFRPPKWVKLATGRFQDAHFKWGGLCRSRLTFHHSPWKRIWSFPMTFELWYWIETIGQWGSWLGINRIFRPSKCIKLATGCSQDGHFKWGLCRSRLTLTFDLSPWPRIWSFRITFELWPWIKTIGQWGSWLGINRIFRPPKCRKRATGRFTKRPFQMRRPVSFAFDLDLSPWPRIWAFRITFELWPWIKTIGQWGSWLGINRIFRQPKCRKRATGRFTKRHKFVSRTSISNEACVVRVWPWPLTLHPGHEFGLFAWPLSFDLELKLLDSGVYDSA